MKKTISILASAIAATSMSASGAVLVAGWENFTGTDAWVPNQKDANTTVTVAATTAVVGRNWGQWSNGTNQGASADGTFGDLSMTVAMADTTVTGGGTNLSLNSSDGTIVFTLTNDSGADRTMSGFYFDNVSKFGQSAKAWTLDISGAISGAQASGSSIQVNGGLPAATDEQRNKFVDLSGVTDNVWEDGTDAVFTLAFTGSANAAGTAGGNELLLDNIGVTVVPEPNSSLLALLGGGLFFLRRRRA